MPGGCAFVTNDLTQLAAANPKDVRPPLLLAYLSYNTGKGADAKYLAVAEANAGANDATAAPCGASGI